MSKAGVFQDFDHRRWDMEAIGLLRGMVDAVAMLAITVGLH